MVIQILKPAIGFYTKDRNMYRIGYLKLLSLIKSYIICFFIFTFYINFLGAYIMLNQVHYHQGAVLKVFTFECF